MRINDGTTDGTINGLKLEIYRLRQALIGGAEGVLAGRDLTEWAKANDARLRATAYEGDEQMKWAEADIEHD